MANELAAIKADLQAANEKVTRIAADVQRLHDRIDEIGDGGPTAEEWAEVKSLSEQLNATLQAVDDATPEE